jgi:vacuolar protein sorting-associated protein 13A/C
MRDDGTGRLARPLGFKARAHLVGRNIEEASLWLPVAPPGYVALGCVASRGFNPPDPDCMRCVRMDLVNQVCFRSVHDEIGMVR